MAPVQDPPVEPAASRRRPYRWAVVVVAAVVVALAGWAIASYLADRQERRQSKWEACAKQVDPPDLRSARLREFFEADDEEAAIERLGREDRRAHRRITAECGERP
jgi:hypothetical protein